MAKFDLCEDLEDLLGHKIEIINTIQLRLLQPDTGSNPLSLHQVE